MGKIKLFENFNEDEKQHSTLYTTGKPDGEVSTIDTYKPEQYAVKPFPGDTGYEMFRKKYHRWLWTVPALSSGKEVPKGPDAPVTESLNEGEEHRVTMGAEKIFKLNGETPEMFVSHEATNKEDVFFLKDDLAVVTDRSGNLTWHGKQGMTYIKEPERVLYVWAGHENEFYSLEDFMKMLNGIYTGKNVKVKAINPATVTESFVNEAGETIERPAVSFDSYMGVWSGKKPDGQQQAFSSQVKAETFAGVKYDKAADDKYWEETRKKRKKTNEAGVMTSDYAAPQFAKKPAPGDTGYALTRKNYHRMLWMNPGKGKKGRNKISAGPKSKGSHEGMQNLLSFDGFLNERFYFTDMGNLKDAIKKAFPKLTKDDFDRHETDLYVKYSDELDKWLKSNYEWYKNVTTFMSNVDKKKWFDIPFAAWDEKHGWRKAKTNEEQTSTDSIELYYEAAKKSPNVRDLTNLEPGDGEPELKWFAFTNTKDENCKVHVFHDADSDTIVMEQDYGKGSGQVGPENDDISLDGFKEYIA